MSPPDEMSAKTGSQFNVPGVSGRSPYQSWALTGCGRKTIASSAMKARKAAFTPCSTEARANSRSA